MAKTPKRKKSWLERILGGPDDPVKPARPKRPKGFLEQSAYDATFTQPVVEGDEWSLEALHSDIEAAWMEQTGSELSDDELEYFTIQTAEVFELNAEAMGYELFWNVRGSEVTADVSLTLDDDEKFMMHEWREEAIEEVLDIGDE